MSLTASLSRAKITALPFASVLALAMAFTSVAHAGECPSDKVGVDVIKHGPKKPKGVTDVVIASIDLAPRYPEYDGFQLRMRRLVIEPGGVVPWHYHGDRPANIYIIDGTIIEHRSTCSVPIEHNAGDVTAEFGDFYHWWKNTSDAPVVLISSDLFKSGMKDDHM